MIAANVFQYAVGALPLLAIVALVTSHSLVNVLAILLPSLALLLVCTGVGFLVSGLFVFFRDLALLLRISGVRTVGDQSSVLSVRDRP